MNWFKRLFFREKVVVPQKTASELLYELRKKRKLFLVSPPGSKEFWDLRTCIDNIQSEIANHSDEFLNPLNPFSPLYMGRDFQGIDNDNHYTDYPPHDSPSHDTGSNHSHDSHSHDSGSSSLSDSTSYDSGSSFSSDSTSYDSGSSYSSDY